MKGWQLVLTLWVLLVIVAAIIRANLMSKIVDAAAKDGTLFKPMAAKTTATSSSLIGSTFDPFKYSKMFAN